MSCWRHDLEHREYVCTCEPPVAGDTGRGLPGEPCCESHRKGDEPCCGIHHGDGAA